MHQVNIVGLTAKQVQAIATLTMFGQVTVKDSLPINRTYRALVKRDIVRVLETDENNTVTYGLTINAKWLFHRMDEAGCLVQKWQPIADAYRHNDVRDKNTDNAIGRYNHRYNNDTFNAARIAFYNATNADENGVYEFADLLIDGAIEYCAILMKVEDNIASRFEGKHNELWFAVEGTKDAALGEAVRKHLANFE